jgi:hypothetical protein
MNSTEDKTWHNALADFLDQKGIHDQFYLVRDIWVPYTDVIGLCMWCGGECEWASFCGANGVWKP